MLDLTRGGGSAGEANGDSYQSIENIVGSTAGDTIYGDGGSNRIDGGSGNDEIRGYLGNDIITGGLGSDVLYGDFPINFPPPWPDSDDKFRYTSLAEILSNDTIKDFGESDFIDLSEADADPVTSGRQAFHFGPGVGQIEIINGNHVQVTGQSGGIDVGFKNNGELVADDFIF
ncbi:hypothetical protein CU100_13930 [Phyllobacterium endophyticum]|uniref:Peptidase M10 serralysin C-terminal domain-containing protein n=1 Tax=Phyllobacterium endophyticum TaxID=1149773 RepID=A0A2P7AWS0_9HYPH|nr:hypothetical protein CU100_13930 [Phyllobacterium endophyticum]